jgi:hypothetical protein
LSVWQSTYVNEPIDWTIDGPVELGVALELELKVGVVLGTAVGAEIELDVVLSIAFDIELEKELVVITKDRFCVSATLEVGAAVVEETEELKLPESWYKLNPFGPPQISRLFAAHAMLPTM